MNKTEIKKALYKQKPKANLQYIRRGVANYMTVIDLGDVSPYEKEIFFEIPVDDMGDADFFPVMDAKLLNRWIVELVEEIPNLTEEEFKSGKAGMIYLDEYGKLKF